jgi:hypothetical protein
MGLDTVLIKWWLKVIERVTSTELQLKCEAAEKNKRGNWIKLSYKILVLMPNHHRDKTRVHMPAKMFPHLKLLCWLFMGPTLSFDTAKKQFLIKFGVFSIKTRFWQYYSWLNMRKSNFNDEFLVLLWPIISRFFACSNVEKNKPKQQRVCALVLSLCS